MAKFKGGSGPSAGTEIKNAIMTGVSWMLPFVIAGAVLMGIARIGASMYGIDNIWDGSHAQAASVVVQLLHKFDGFGGMALSLMLGEAGYTAESIDTTADVSLDKTDSGFAISKIALQSKVTVPGIDPQQFDGIIQKAKAGCPVSQVLKAEIPLDYTLN